MKENSENYSLNGLQQSINSFFKFLFYYRLLLIIIAVIALGALIWIVALHSKPEDVLKNVSTVATCGSIVIGIFYSILNFEVATLNKRKDLALAKKSLTFSVAFEWHKDSFVKHLKVVKNIREEHKAFIEGNNSAEFANQLDGNAEARASLVSVFNYLECVATGIEAKILDEEFVYAYFKSIMIELLDDYQFYIIYRRKKDRQPTVWIKWTDLASKFKNN